MDEQKEKPAKAAAKISSPNGRENGRTKPAPVKEAKKTKPVKKGPPKKKASKHTKKKK